jgi:tRNA-dihydrouridine synthase C
LIFKDFSPDRPALFLAPMEGVTDFAFRKLITQFQPIDFCVTEFLRVTKTLHPNKVILRHMPELLTNSRTNSGTPVILQLLGGQAEPLAQNAARADKMGAFGIDLNFGCPAKLVNRHDGGASLLKEPQRIYNIIKTVRESVHPSKPVSAKIRLGFSDTSLLLENAKAAEEAGSSWLTVHCRTKEQGYRPPAHWQYIPQIKEHVKIPIIANGDLFNIEDFKACREMAGTAAYMLGRGVLRNPQLLTQIKSLCEPKPQIDGSWPEIQIQVNHFFDLSEQQINSSFAAARTKQWLKFLMQDWDEASTMFQDLKTYRGDEFRHRMKALNTVKIQIDSAPGAG